MSLYDLIASRRTIREFQKKTVSRELIEKFVNAGRLAPQAANIQPLEFVIVDDPSVCSKMFSLVRFAGYLKWNPSADKQPAAYVVILLNRELQNVKNGAFDAAFASENICLAAWGEGVGSCVIGSFSEEKVRELLSVPDKFSASLIIVLGYPAHESFVEEMKGDDVKYWRDENGNFHVPKRPLKKLIHYNKFCILMILALLVTSSCGGSQGGADDDDDDDDAVLSFFTSTGESVAPGATDVITHAPFVATFTESVNSSSVDDNFFIVEGAKSSADNSSYDSAVCDFAGALESSVECSGDGETATSCTLNPKLFLSGETDYSLCVTTEVEYSSGDPFEGATVSFTTGEVQLNQSACGDTSIPVLPVVENIPFDIENVRRISKFRSCIGHSMNDAFEPTPYTSMKHYVYGPAGHANCYEAEVYAPFDGTVIGALADTDVTDDDDHVNAGCDESASTAYVAIQSTEYPRFTVNLEHVNPVSGIEEGVTVTAGEEVGYGVLPTPENGSWDLVFGTVDISYDLFISDSGLSLYSYCSVSEFLTEDAAAVLAGYGINDLDELVFTKSEREANECEGTMGENGQINFEAWHSEDDNEWVIF